MRPEKLRSRLGLLDEIDAVEYEIEMECKIDGAEGEKRMRVKLASIKPQQPTKTAVYPATRELIPGYK